ncbi:MAG: polyprenyl synthetase family protein [Acidiferrobacterales bacterium]
MAQASTPKGFSSKDFLNYWSAIRAQLDEEVVCRVPKFFSNLPAEQIEAIHQTLADSKRIRGCLVCIMSNALGGRIEDAIPRAVAIECIHAASLIHDDYVDNDTVRRNRPATWAVEGPRKAVLLGDIIFATAIQKMVEMSRDDGLVITQAIATMANGAYQELLDPLDLSRAVTEGSYRRELYNLIGYLKTGALFGAASQLGAISAGASSEMATLAFTFGARVGEAYQIADDLHEIVALDAHATDLPAKISLLAPVFLYFAEEMTLQVARLLAGREHNLQQWFHQAQSILKTRMEYEIKVRLDLATKAIRGFPTNRYTRILHAAPSEIVGMMQKTDLLSDVSNYK